MEDKDRVQFRTAKGKIIPDLVGYLKDYMKDKYHNYGIYIGCDSKVRGSKLMYITVICIHKPGSGIHIIHKKNFQPLTKSIHTKIWWEVEYALETATYLRDNGVLENENLTFVHLDISTNKKFKSNVLLESAVGYITSYGFNCVVKPDSWAATHAADKLVRIEKPKN